MSSSVMATSTLSTANAETAALVSLAPPAFSKSHYPVSKNKIKCTNVEMHLSADTIHEFGRSRVELLDKRNDSFHLDIWRIQIVVVDVQFRRGIDLPCGFKGHIDEALMKGH